MIRVEFKDNTQNSKNVQNLRMILMGCNGKNGNLRKRSVRIDC
jgi:hypothetical protein